MLNVSSQSTEVKSKKKRKKKRNKNGDIKAAKAGIIFLAVSLPRSLCVSVSLLSLDASFFSSVDRMI